MNISQATSIGSILPAGSFATVPPQISARWITRDVPATLLCFPNCIPYVSVRRGLTSDVRRTFVAAYYPVFDSARFTAGSVQLSYRWLHASPFSVHVLREKEGSCWHVFKCQGRQLLSHVVGGWLWRGNDSRDERWINRWRARVDIRMQTREDRRNPSRESCADRDRGGIEAR